MKSTVETLSPTRVRLAVEVPFDELRPSLDRAYKSIAGQIKIPGFRPGKAPARIIDQRVGRATVLQEAVQDAIPRAYAEAVSTNQVRVLGQPDIELTKIEDGSTIEFTAEVDVRPEVPLPDLGELSVSVEDAVLSEGDIDEELASLRERFAVLKAADRPAQDGDYVSIDMIATVDGAEIEGGSTTGLSHEVGKGDLIPGLDEALVGMSSGESRTFTTQLPAGEHAGRDAEVTVTVRSVKEKELPELDDEFAGTASEFDTLDELRTDIQGRMERVSAVAQALQARDKVLEALLEAVDVPLPESVVGGELEWRQQSLNEQLEGAGLRLEEYLEREGQSQEEFDAELTRTATNAVKTQLVLDAVAEAEQVGVSEAELTDYLVSQARRYGMSPQDFAQQMSQSGNLTALIAQVRRDKALLTVLEAADVTDASGNPVDVSVLRRTMSSVQTGAADTDDEDDDEDEPEWERRGLSPYDVDDEDEYDDDDEPKDDEPEDDDEPSAPGKVTGATRSD